jgi:excisionase family DNA binding protein
VTLIEQLRTRSNAMTVEDLSELLAMSVRALYREVEEDRIPYFRVRTSIRFDPHQIADWLEEKMPQQSVRPQKRAFAAGR